MRKCSDQKSQATTPTKGSRRGSVKCDWRESSRERVVARTRRKPADRPTLTSTGSWADFGTNNPIAADDFSDPVPVCARELDAIERYLGAEIDQLLRLCK